MLVCRPQQRQIKNAQAASFPFMSTMLSWGKCTKLKSWEYVKSLRSWICLSPLRHFLFHDALSYIAIQLNSLPCLCPFSSHLYISQNFRPIFSLTKCSLSSCTLDSHSAADPHLSHPPLLLLLSNNFFSEVQFRILLLKLMDVTRLLSRVKSKMHLK